MAVSSFGLSGVIVGASILFLATFFGAILGILMRKEHIPLGYFSTFSAGIMAYSAVHILQVSLSNFGFLTSLAGMAFGLLAFLALESFLSRFSFFKRHPGCESVFCLLVAISVHNIPEGIAVGSAFFSSDKTGLLVALPVAVQDIPEGFLVAAPLFLSGFGPLVSVAAGTIAGLFEALIALSISLFLSAVPWFAPYILPFSAGAIFYVILFDLVPENDERIPAKKRAVAFALGAILAISADLVFFRALF